MVKKMLAEVIWHQYLLSKTPDIHWRLSISMSFISSWWKYHCCTSRENMDMWQGCSCFITSTHRGWPGWVDLRIWLHTEMVYSPETVIHLNVSGVWLHNDFVETNALSSLNQVIDHMNMWTKELWTTIYHILETFAFSALTLLVWRQEGHPARKKYGGMVKVGTG